MKKAYFPMFIDISEKKILVIGGGSIAARRVSVLMKFTHRITVVAPYICEALLEAAYQKEIECLTRMWKPSDIVGFDIVLAATDDREINCRVGNLCKEENILVNVADDKGKCDFYFPGIIQTDDVVIGISTAGKDPGKSKAVRKKVESLLQQ